MHRRNNQFVPRKVLGVLLSVTLAVGFSFLGADAALAAGPVYPVMNTGEYPPDGVFFRTAPDWNQTTRTVGLGVYSGDRVELSCWQSGGNVPRRDGRSNTVWYQAKNVTRPQAPAGRANQGWINAHFVNDGTGPNQVAPGVPACGATPTPPVVTPPTAPASTTGCYDGLKWTKHTLTYSYPGTHRYKGNVYQAVANWNALGAGVTITPAPAGQFGDIVFLDYYTNSDTLMGTTIIPNQGHGSPTLPTRPLNVPRPIRIQLNQRGMDNPKLGDRTQTDLARTFAATHELGHALGLAHPEDCRQNVDSIMHQGTSAFYTNRLTFTTPREADRRQIAALFAF